MCTLLAKLAIGLSATMATGFYYLAAAPPASAGIDVCGPGNFSDQCVKGQQSTSASSSTSLRDAKPEAQVAEPQVAEPQVAEPQVAEPQVATPDPVPELPAVESPLVTPEPVPTPSAVESPLVTPEPTEQLPAAQPPAIENPIVSPSPIVAPTPNFPNIYTNSSVRTTAIPEPGTVVALLLTGAGIICAGRKRNKQVPQQR